MDFKSYIAPVLAGMLGGALIMGLSFMMTDKTVVLPEDFDIYTYIDIEDLKGDRGDRGFVGAMGGMGATGAMGATGTPGVDADIDLDDLTDDVIDEIEDREDADVFTFDGEDGDYTLELDIRHDGDYRFEIRHFGSDDFDVSLEDEDGDVEMLVDGEGHLSHIMTRDLERGDYILRVSADGDWNIEVEEK